MAPKISLMVLPLLILFSVFFAYDSAAKSSSPTWTANVTLSKFPGTIRSGDSTPIMISVENLKVDPLYFTQFQSLIYHDDDGMTFRLKDYCELQMSEEFASRAAKGFLKKYNGPFLNLVWKMTPPLGINAKISIELSTGAPSDPNYLKLIIPFSYKPQQLNMYQMGKKLKLSWSKEALGMKLYYVENHAEGSGDFVNSIIVSNDKTYSTIIDAPGESVRYFLTDEKYIGRSNVVVFKP